MITETNVFWLVLFIVQIVVLSLLSRTFHSYLSYLTGVSSGTNKFSHKIFGFFLFIGTLVHELSHIFMAAILFVRVKALNLKSEITEEKHIKLGTAEVENVDPFRNALVGIAPLLFGIILIYFLAASINLNNFSWIEVFKLVLISQISNSMFLSKSDTVYFKYLIILILIIAVILYFLNIRFNLINLVTYLNRISEFLNASTYINFLKNLNLIFLLVSIFNFFVVLFLSFLSKYKRY